MQLLLWAITLMGLSGRIYKGEIWVYDSPKITVEKAGKIKGKGRFVVVKKGPKCQGARWYKLDTGHWVCSSYFIVNNKKPNARTNWAEVVYNRQYYYSTAKVSFIATSLKNINRNKWRRLKHLRGFLPVKRLLIGLEPYMKLISGAYISERNLRPYTPSKLQGVSLRKRQLPLAFVTGKKAALYRSRRGVFKPWKRIKKYAVRPVSRVNKNWYRVRYARFARLKRSDIALARAVPKKPKGVKKDEPWVHIDLKEKLLYAMRGSRLQLVTLVAASPKTMRGTHRLFLLRVFQDYDLVHSKDGYYLEMVPYVMYYNKGFAIHAAYWHDKFPDHTTHGCVNLSMKDAKWLFHFLNPTFPRGYIEYRLKKGRGALVRVVG